MINDIMDLHTHTIVSGHAYNTLYEMARAAADRRPHPDAAPAPAAVTALLTDGPQVINLGLASFADDLIEQQAGVVHWNWTPPAGGDPRLARLVDLLMER